MDDAQVPSAELTLAIALDAGHPRGTLRDGDGAPLPFSGWLELAGAIEALRARALAAADGGAASTVNDVADERDEET